MRQNRPVLVSAGHHGGPWTAGPLRTAGVGMIRPMRLPGEGAASATIGSRPTRPRRNAPQDQRGDTVHYHGTSKLWNQPLRGKEPLRGGHDAGDDRNATVSMAVAMPRSPLEATARWEPTRQDSSQWVLAKARVPGRPGSRTAFLEHFYPGVFQGQAINTSMPRTTRIQISCGHAPHGSEYSTQLSLITSSFFIFTRL